MYLHVKLKLSIIITYKQKHIMNTQLHLKIAEAAIKESNKSLQAEFLAEALEDGIGLVHVHHVRGGITVAFRTATAYKNCTMVDVAVHTCSVNDNFNKKIGAIGALETKKIVIHCQTNTVGTDSWEFVEVDINSTKEDLDDLAYEYAVGKAEMYGIYPPSDDDTDEEAENADYNIEGCWYDYSAEKHDMYTCGGVPHWN